MIKTWKHKGLKRFFETGSTAGVQATHKRRLKILLQTLNAAKNAKNMNIPSFRFHRLTGSMKDHYSVTVNKNWRVIFQFKNGSAYVVDYLDYH